MSEGSNRIDFPIMQGGLLYQFYIRFRMVKPPLDLYKRRIIFITLLAWVPLFILAILGGTAISGVKVPFLFDLETHIRFLVVIGLLILAEVIAQERLPVIVNQFIERDIITPAARAEYNKIVDSTLKLSNSVITELVLLVLVYTLGHFIWTEHTALSVPTWYASFVNGQLDLTMAGFWYIYISLPIFQFILVRWYFRIFIWMRFLWNVSKLPLHLNSLHPDRAGGLGFLNISVSAFKLVLFAHTTLLAGFIGNRILHAGQTLINFKLEIAAVIVFLCFLVLIPYLFYVIPLSYAKRKGLVEYGDLACDYVNDFRTKWIANGSTKPRITLGTSDLQSLADLANSFAVTNEMRLFPCNRYTIIELMLFVLIPLLPLIFTIIPINSIIDKVIKILL